MADPKTTKKASPEPSSSEYAAMDRSVKEMLEAQPKVRIRPYQVPRDSSDEPLPDLTCSVNGYTYQIQRGHSVDVPETVAEILAEAGHV